MSNDTDLLTLKRDPRVTRWSLGRDVIEAERHFGSEISVSRNGEVVVKPTPAKSFGAATVPLSSGESVEVVVRAVPLNPPDVWMRHKGRSVPDDVAIKSYCCGRCRASLGALDTSCRACGTATHDLRATTLAQRLREARFVLLVLAASFFALGVAIWVVNGPALLEAELDLYAVAPLALGVALFGLAQLARTKPLFAFLAALALVVPTLVAWLVQGSKGTSWLIPLLIVVALYRGAKAAFAADADRTA